MPEPWEENMIPPEREPRIVRVHKLLREKRKRGRWWRYPLFALSFLVGGFFAYLAVTPSPIDAVSWDAPLPSAAPVDDYDGPPMQALTDFRLGAEHALVGPGDRVLTGTIDGKICALIRNDPDTPGLGKLVEWKDVGGRPLGLLRTDDGSVWVANAGVGLQRITPDGDVQLAADEAAGEPIHFANALDQLPDGSIVFSDSTRDFGQASDNMDTVIAAYDTLEARPHGRLLRYDPATQETTVLLDGLYFPNGVAVSPDGRWIYFAETPRYRVMRWAVDGSVRPRVEVVADNLPGFPDGIDFDDRGNLYVACPQLRSGWLDRLHRSPLLKNTITKLPRAWWHRPGGPSLVLRLNPDGGIDTTALIHGSPPPMISSVTWTPDAIWLGSLSSE